MTPRMPYCHSVTVKNSLYRLISVVIHDSGGMG